jgi:predicted acyl esterase
MPLLTRLVIGVASCLAWVSALQGQDASDLASYIRLHYAKAEHLIPMRDGVKLFTSIYLPCDKTRTYPFMLHRTLYSVTPYGTDKYPKRMYQSEHFVRAGYIFVNQDVRGKFMSEGAFIQVTPHVPTKRQSTDIDESTDTYDTIEWLLKNVPGHNGRVGMSGISYPGFYSSAGMIDAHPALKAVSPQAPNRRVACQPGEGMDLQECAVMQEIVEVPVSHCKLFLEAGNADAVARQLFKNDLPFWREMFAHPDRDAFWQRRNILPHLKNVAPAVMVVAGWFDAEDLYGSFKTYEAIERQNPSVNNVLVVGPWSHGGWSSGDGDRLGPISFGSKTAAFHRSEIEFPFFEHYLKDHTTPSLAEATVFETGSNVWRTFETWPPRSAVLRQLFLQEGGQLGFAAPTGEHTYDEYISDPAKPVPFTERITSHMHAEYMVEDQRFAARRPDVLVYQTAALTDDLVAAGPLEIQLWASTTATDADFVVKLIDEFPDNPDPLAQPGFQLMVRSETFRGRYRNGFDRPEPFVPGKQTLIRMELLDVLHRFQKGHRIMIQIQSSWFPLVDRNPQKFVPNIYSSKPEDYEKATHRIHRSKEFPTHVRLRALTPINIEH